MKINESQQNSAEDNAAVMHQAGDIGQQGNGSKDTLLQSNIKSQICNRFLMKYG